MVGHGAGGDGTKPHDEAALLSNGRQREIIITDVQFKVFVTGFPSKLFNKELGKIAFLQ
jgi:hypothetical protein